MHVSIHAPPEGRDKRGNPGIGDVFLIVSIHAPPEGRDED